MADQKITELNNILGSALADADEFVVVDITADETMAITRAELKLGLGLDQDVSTTGTPTFAGVVTGGNVDGRDVSVDGAKLDLIEAAADVTDATNVTAAGALMDSELTAIASVKALDQGVATTDSPTFVDVTPTGGIYLGGSVAANYMDDYEEGSYTATLTPITSGTLTLNSTIDLMSYTKKGREVTVQGFIEVTSGSSPVGTDVDINLPFASASLSEESDRPGTMIIWSPTFSGVAMRIISGGDSVARIKVDASTLVSTSFYVSFTYVTA